MFSKTKKLLLILLVSLEILALNSYPVLAFLNLGFPFTSGSSNGGFASPTSMMEEIEKRYNIDPESTKQFMHEFNVSSQKGVAPETQVFYNPADPKPGEEVTATAMASGFENKKEGLVYRWYLKRNGCDLGCEGSCNMRVCDTNEDGEVTIDDWITAATIKIANNGFRDNRVDYGGTDDDADNDGYDILNVFGGGDKQYIDDTEDDDNERPRSNQQCYIHDFKSGTNYEIVDEEFNNNGEPGCEDGETAICVRTIPYIGAQDFYASAEGEGEGGSGGSGGSGGDPPSGGTGGTGGSAGAASIVNGFTMETGGQCVDTKEKPFCNEGGGVSCTNGKAICYPGTPPTSRIICKATRCEINTGDDVLPWMILVTLPDGTEVRRCEENCQSENGDPILGSGSYPGCEGDPEPYEYNGNFSEPGCDSFDGSPEDSVCDHFFPEYDGARADRCGVNQCGDGEEYPNCDALGDGHFSDAEECYWGTNPKDSGTKENLRNDEAVAAGLGQDKFTWIYQPGDKVGVFVEGTSFYPTKYDDSSKMVMFAMPNNSCIENGNGTPGTKVVPDVRNQNVDVETIQLGGDDWNECFENNLTDPTQGGQGKKINVKLSYSPQNPINGQDETRGDLVILKTSLEDSNRDESTLFYKYTIWAAPESRDSGTTGQPGVGAPPPIDSYTDETALDEAGWTNITSDLRQTSNINDSPSPAYFEGNGLSTVKFRLNSSPMLEGMKYLLAVVEIFEGNRSNELSAGASGALITMNNSGANLNISLANSGNGTSLSGDIQICQNGSSGMCEVIPGQVLQVSANNTAVTEAGQGSADIEMNNYQWSMDGKQINCSETMGTGCSLGGGGERQGGTIYFPINGSPGDVVTLNMNANDVDPNNNDYVAGNNLGLTTNIAQQFLIVEPRVKIEADGQNVWSAVLGEYYPDGGDDACNYEEITSAGTRTTNTCIHTSQSVFGSNSHNLTLTAQYFPKWLDDLVTSNPDMFSFQWIVDGQEVEGTGRSLDYSASDQIYVHTVTVNVMFKQDIGTRQAVSKFGSSSQEQYFSDTVQVEVFGASAMTQSGPRKYFASLISNVPTQMVFMIRIALTIFVIILIANIVSSANLTGKRYAFQNRYKE